MSKKTRTFEEKLERIGEIVSQLERGNMGLQESIALFKEGSALTKECKRYLEKTELEIQKVIDESGSTEKFTA
ncbi:Exodeoxyribonuclease 7 small subunit [Candidatus Norongarragalina meridionalis]|nr:Exodeoxyribonuclease 7 small subunit [Candidatus Norongarragalina meridionalis]